MKEIKRPCKSCSKLFLLNELFSYVDGNNAAITKNSPEYCEPCYIKRYGAGY